MSPPVQGRGIGNVLGSKDPELLEEQGQAPTERSFRQKIILIKYFNPIKKRKGLEEPLQKDKPPMATAQ